MSKNSESAKLAIHVSSSNSTIMALAKVGNGPRWTTANSSRKQQIRICGRGLFTKWVEAKALANITAPTIQKFFWKNIVCRFGVPRELTVDNGKQFGCYSFKEYCKTLVTHAKFSSVYHSQSNGAVERANELIFSGIKKCLFDQKKGKWTDELPKVIGLITPQCQERWVSHLFAYSLAPK
jgi:transposase InsO family protein